MPFLRNGERFPQLEILAVGGGTIVLPNDQSGSYGVVLIYRESWCPYCRAQLASFNRAASALEEVGVKVIALSVDDEATATALVEKHDLKFPVGHSADAPKIGTMTGAYLRHDPLYLQSTGFILNPDGTVLTAVYSSDAIGRLLAEDVVGFVRCAKSHA